MYKYALPIAMFINTIGIHNIYEGCKIAYNGVSYVIYGSDKDNMKDELIKIQKEIEEIHKENIEIYQKTYKK